MHKVGSRCSSTMCHVTWEVTETLRMGSYELCGLGTPKHQHLSRTADGRPFTECSHSGTSRGGM